MKNVRSFTDIGSSVGLSSSWDFVGDPYDDLGTDDFWNSDPCINNGYPYFSRIVENPPADPPASGDGTTGNPYQIATLNNFYWMTVNPGEWDKHYTQIADIDASPTTSWADGNGFNPIGNDMKEFTGSYNAYRHDIADLFINRPSTDNIGLFGYTSDAVINNFCMTNVDITGNNSVGGLVGRIDWDSVILYSYATGSVNGNDDVGGLGGNTNSATIEDCYFTGSVNANEDVGGLVGSVSASTLSNNFSTGVVIGINTVGGLAGNIYSVSAINNNYSTSSVSGDNSVAGLIGRSEDSTVNKCYSTGSVSGESSIGGLIGDYVSGIIINCFFDMVMSGQINSPGGTGKTTTEMKDIATYTDLTTDGLDEAWDFLGNPNDDTGIEDIWNIDGLRTNDGYPFLFWQQADTPSVHPPVNGNGTSGDPYQIATLNNLYWIMIYQNEWDKHYIQTANINATSTYALYSGNGFIPIGDNITRFTGSYNGQDHTIDGLFIDRPSTDDIGLFGYIDDNAELNNIGLINVNITGDNKVGGLVGVSINSSISNSYTTGFVSGNGYYIGGLVGDLVSNSNISSNYFTGSVTGEDDVGGLVGVTANSCTVINCYASGSVTGTGDTTGGLVGALGSSSSISSSYATSSVTGSEYAVGGLVGANKHSSIINNCYATGSVTGNDSVGGLVGRNIIDSFISNCYSTGPVNGNYPTGGLIGQNDAFIFNSFWDTETSLQSSSAGGIGKTTTEMKDVATFTDESTVGLDDAWDFVGTPYDDTGTEDIWNIDDLRANDGYPFLYWQVGVESPATPTNVIITIVGNDVQLNWDEVTGATAYKIYSSDNPYSGFDEDTSGTFVDESWTAPIPNGKMFYYVKAVN